METPRQSCWRCGYPAGEQTRCTECGVTLGPDADALPVSWPARIAYWLGGISLPAPFVVSFTLSFTDLAVPWRSLAGPALGLVCGAYAIAAWASRDRTAWRSPRDPRTFAGAAVLGLLGVSLSATLLAVLVLG